MRAAKHMPIDRSKWSIKPGAILEMGPAVPARDYRKEQWIAVVASTAVSDPFNCITNADTALENFDARFPK